MMIHDKIFYKKALVFLEEKSIVHVKLYNGTYYNGRLFSVTDNYLVIHDRERGLQKVFFIELKFIDEYKEGGGK